jgi:tRNA threonylcarbamoyladenosine biosynthesis protein TsaE
MIAYRNLTLSQLEQLASELAEELKDKSLTIGLTGNLGSGKTTFTKAFARALGIKKITSPTFVIMHEHPSKHTTLYHLDLYRLTKASELTQLGLADIRKQKDAHILIIEWIEKFPQLKKSCNLLLTFKIKPNNLRDVQIQAN